jgi:hypothetical protein
MIKYLFTLAVVLFITILTSFNDSGLNRNGMSVGTRTNYSIAGRKFSNLTMFEYVWGPQSSTMSYRKVLFTTDVTGYCLGNERLCAILAEEDIFNNPGHPTQSSLNFLLANYGFFFYFPYEVPGLVGFKDDDEVLN